MTMLGPMGFVFVQCKPRHGPCDPAASAPAGQRLEELQVGVRGGTYGYWYVRHLGSIFIAPNYMPAQVKGEVDLIGSLLRAMHLELCWILESSVTQILGKPLVRPVRPEKV